MKSYRQSLIACFATTCLLCAGSSAQESGAFKIVVNAQNPVSALSKAQLSSLYQRRTKTWDSGEPVQPVHQVPTSTVREAFARDVLGGSVTATNTTDLFAVASDRDVLAFVRLKPGAIGYVSASAPADGVKVLSVRRGDTFADANSQDALPVGGGIALPTRIVEVRPTYPSTARQARISGEVVIQIVIGTTGAVEQARVTKSVPMLDEAALAAVRQWRYSVTRVNGVPVPVTMTVRVNFEL